MGALNPVQFAETLQKGLKVYPKIPPDVSLQGKLNCCEICRSRRLIAKSNGFFNHSNITIASGYTPLRARKAHLTLLPAVSFKFGLR